MKYSIFGLPGSGKGLYSKYLEKATGAVQLSTGDLLRDIKQNDHSEIGDSVRALGPTDFASDELIIRAIKKELEKEKYSNGVIFDGFPRTLKQAEKMIEMELLPDAVIVIDCSEKAILERIEGRRVHIPSGRVYHTKNAPPLVEGKDDITGENLTIREDDKPEYMQTRFNDFKEKTQPAIDLLKSKCKNGSGPVFAKVSGEISPEEAYKDLDITIGSINAIHKIRKDHAFTLISMAYSGGNKMHHDLILREALHQSLMLGEIPFSSEIFYFQKNMLNRDNENHVAIVNEVSKEILKKCEKLVLISRKENDESGSLLHKDGHYLSKDNLKLYELAKDLNKKVSLHSENYYDPRVKKYLDQSVSVDFVSNEINSGEALDSLLNRKNKENMIEVVSPDVGFVIIESPYAGDKETILRNENYARASALSCLDKGEIPFASHILYTQEGILDDTKPAQRRLGIEAGLAFGGFCNKSVLFADLGMTEGMIEGIEKAKTTGRNVEIRNLDNFKNLYDKAIEKLNKSRKHKI